jgi:GWxTD domain-containing protein
MKPTVRFHYARACASGSAIIVLLLCPAALFAQDDSPARRNFPEESRQILRLCHNFSAPTRGELASLHPLLTEDELLDLLALRSEDSVRLWIDEYWRNHDPLFTTTENEARIEHDRRAEFATTWFGHAEWPGWDQRGEICIRYGLPSGREIESAEVISPGTYVRPTELWYYPNLDMIVQFEDAYGNGSYTYLLEHVQLPSYERPRNDRRTMASEYLPDMNMEWMTTDAEIGDHIPNPSYEFLFDDFQDGLLRFPQVLEETPVVYPFDFATMRVPFDFDVAVFKGGDSVDRVDVNAEFEPGKISAPGAIPHQYRATAAFFDRDSNVVARLSHTATVESVSAAAESLFAMVMQLPFTLSPASYNLAITLEEMGTGRFTSLRKLITCDDFERRLALSTVCFSSRIETATNPSAFTRGALEVVPRPSARYELTTSVPVYFEVYNLAADGDGTHRYTVSYRVVPLSPAPKSLWKKIVGGSQDAATLASSFQSAATGSNDVVYLFVKTDRLWPGDFELDVAVVDEVSKEQTNRKGRFSLVE